MYKGCQSSYRTCFGEIKGEGTQVTPSIMHFYRLSVLAKLALKRTLLDKKCARQNLPRQPFHNLVTNSH